MPTNHDNLKTKELLTKSFLSEGPSQYWVGEDSTAGSKTVNSENLNNRKVNRKDKDALSKTVQTSSVEWLLTKPESKIIGTQARYQKKF